MYAKNENILYFCWQIKFKEFNNLIMSYFVVKCSICSFKRVLFQGILLSFFVILEGKVYE